MPSDNLQPLQPTLKRLSADGAIGDPRGVTAYAYIRVSSEKQAEEGAGGLPRQIEHIHEVAREQGYRVPLDLVFADDDSGFDYKKRPELNRLRNEVKSRRRRADHVVIEYIDRLSRKTYHQGFLLEEMSELGVKVTFWKAPGNKIEQMVMGYVSEEGMLHQISRMREGTRSKAISGRITAKRPAFGYRIVDRNGADTPDSRKWTYYALHDEQAAVVRWIFQQYAYTDTSLKKLAEELVTRYPVRGWDQTRVSRIIKSPLYRGEYIANRLKKQTVPQYDANDNFVGMRTVEVVTDESEWVTVPVPAIVDVALWQAANDRLQRNEQTARRNGKRDYLLTGLVKCDCCGRTYIGRARKRQTKSYLYYQCSSRLTAKHIRDEIRCTQAAISAEVLERAIWNVVSAIFTDPSIIIDHLNRQLSGDQNAQIRNEIEYMERQLQGLDEQDERAKDGFRLGVFTADEAKQQRETIRRDRLRISQQLDALRKQVILPEDVEAQKSRILQLCESAVQSGKVASAPPDVKKHFIGMVIDSITLNVEQGWFRLEGLFRSEAIALQSTV
ncbi:MAG: recombinase family protein [Anaerolineae bacterium]|nr:recombinase family protein [Anaerolineae bacterium]